MSKDWCRPLCVKPISVVTVPGKSVTITLPATLPTTPGTCFTLLCDRILENHTGTEEVIVVIGGTDFPAVDNWGYYVTSQMLHNRDNKSPLTCNRFRIQIVANGATPAVAFRRGLTCRRTTINVVAPPTP